MIQSTEMVSLTNFRVVTDDKVIRTIGVGATQDTDLKDLIKGQVDNIKVEIQGREAKGEIRQANLKISYDGENTLSISININKIPGSIQMYNFLDFKTLMVALDVLRELTGIDLSEGQK